MTVSHPIAPGLGPLRASIPGLTEDLPTPPQIAESGDPFSDVRVLALAVRLQRGLPQRIADVVDRLNATYLDWQFTPRVVTDAFVAMAADWMVDYRNVDGILLEDGPYGATVRIEDSHRVDPWFAQRAEVALARCHAALAAFARRDQVAGDG